MRAVRAVEYVRANACKGITAADVIRQMGMKVRMAEYRFREVAKRSIRDEIIAVRVARAKELLRNSTMSVNDILSQMRLPRSAFPAGRFHEDNRLFASPVAKPEEMIA